MKNTFILGIGVMLMVIQMSCNKEHPKKQATPTLLRQNYNKGTYAIDTKGVKVQWIAYKFTDKTGVKGTFNELNCIPKNETGSIAEILKGLTLKIPTATVASGNAIRDFKLRTHFFSTFNTHKLTGTIFHIKDYEGFLKLKMNSKDLIIPFTYSVEADTIKLFTHLNLLEWSGQPALTELSKQCNEFNKGDDGVSKLWPGVDVSIKLPIILKDDL